MSESAMNQDSHGTERRWLLVRQQMEKNKIPGLAIGFIKDDYIWVKGFGYADLENKIPAKAESAYRFASIQKSMTAVAILQLAEQGKINIDAEIQNYVPYFPKKKYPITIRQLLGHSLFGARPGVGHDPANRQAGAAILRHLDRHLVVGAAHATGLDLK